MFALHRYRPALTLFLEARQLAGQANDVSAQAAFDANIASLYSESGDLDAVAQWIESGLERLSGNDRKLHLPKLLIQLATLRASQNRMGESLELFRRGVEAADAGGDVGLVANGWNRLGEEWLKRGDLEKAEGPLLEAYRLRRFHGLPLDTSYRNLGRLRLQQGDLVSASALLDRGVELAARPGGPLPAWDVYHYRGRVRLAQGRLREALDDLRVAVRLGRTWRWSAAPGDAARIGAEGWLASVYSALIEAGARLYLETHDAALLREAFEAAEENRAASLRAVTAARAAEDGLPPDYWAALGRLQRAEVAALRGEAGGAVRAREARADMLRVEAAQDAGYAPPGRGVLERMRRALPPGSALVAFHVGESASWLWALDARGLAMHRLPPAVEIGRQVSAAAAAIRDQTAEARTLAATLSSTLFGTLEPRFLDRGQWLVALDGVLFEAPLAALPDPRHPASYLAETREVALVPGAGYWLDSKGRRGSRRSTSGTLLAVGDAIYNAADSRYRAPAGPTASWFGLSLLAAQTAGSQPGLPRLVGSHAELAACARAWAGDRVLLEGENASRSNLIEKLGRSPAVVHFATHMLAEPGAASNTSIALSLTRRGEPELVSPQEIAGWRMAPGVVVLSGCHSAAAAALPGTGLMGLTRAWLEAGARAVTASRWNVPDDDGCLFAAVYRHLRAGDGAAAALRLAQVDMIRSGSWRANPRYWGAYFVIGAE